MVTYLTSCVLPPESSRLAKNNYQYFQNQLKILVASWISYQSSKTRLIIYTNERSLISKWLSVDMPYIHENLLLLHTTIENSHCLGHEGASFTYAFSKLDAIHDYKKSRYYTQENIILTDLDCCLLSDSNDMIIKLNNSTVPIAIDYKNEMSINDNDFIQCMKIVNPFSNHHNLMATISAGYGWLNSGFILITPQYLDKIISYSQEATNNLRTYRDFVSRSINHYSDELVFSALAFDQEFNRLSDFQPNGIAIFLWTIPTATRTPHTIPILRKPIHLHLPASKSQPNLVRVLLSTINMRNCIGNEISSIAIVAIINLLNIIVYRNPAVNYIKNIIKHFMVALLRLRINFTDRLPI